MATHHTDTTRLRVHTAEEARCAQHDYGALPAGFRLSVFTVSTLGSFGPAAQALLAELGRRVGGGVPYALPILDEATWAAQVALNLARELKIDARRRKRARSRGRPRVSAQKCAPCRPTPKGGAPCSSSPRLLSRPST